MTSTTIQAGISQPTISEGSTVGSPKRLARIAGLLYLVVGILGGFAFAGVYTAMYVAGDASTTASNLVANAGLVRIGVAADLIQVTFWVFLSLTLYTLLRHVNAYAARAMVVLVAIGASISSPQHPLRVPGHAGRNRPGVPRGRRHRRVDRAGHADARPPALRLRDRRDLLRPVARAARIPRFQVRHVPQGAGHRARRRRDRLPLRHARDVRRARCSPPVIHPVAALLGVVAEVSLLAYLLIKGVRSPVPMDRPSPAASAIAPASA